MVRRAADVASECINCVGRGGGTNGGFESVTVNDIDRAVKQSGNVFFQPGIVEDGDVSHGIEFDHDVDIAVGPVVTPRARAEEGGVPDAPRPQSRLVFPQPGKNFLTVHIAMITEKAALVSRIEPPSVDSTYQDYSFWNDGFRFALPHPTGRSLERGEDQSNCRAILLREVQTSL